MDEVKNRIFDFIDSVLLQSIREAFSSYTNTTVFILDISGGEVIAPLYTDTVYKMIHTGGGIENIFTDLKQESLESIKESNNPLIASCPLIDFTLLAIPIWWEDQIVGAWLICHANPIIINPDEDFQAAKKQVLENTVKSISIITKELIHSGKRAKHLEFQNRSLQDLSEQLNAALTSVYGYIDISGVNIYITDVDTHDILLCNKYFADQHSSTVKDIVGTKCYRYFGFNEPCPFCPKARLTSEHVENTKYLDWEVKIDSHNKWYHVNSRMLPWMNESRESIMSSYYDITEKKELQDQLSYIAFYDQRLKVPNGILLAKDIQAYISKNSFLVCFDLQELRKINEAYGREAGDTLLEEIKAWINRLPYYGLNFYRIEGDGFAIFIQDYSENEVYKLAKIIWDRFSSPWNLKLGSMRITVFVGISMGIIPCIQEFKDYTILISTIERVIDMAKKKNDILVYNEEVSEAFYIQLRLELSLKHCILNSMQGFSVYYQPIADPNTGTWTSMESLCRWNSPEFGPVSPAQFIPIAETNGLIGFIDLWVLEKAIEQVKLWKLDKLSRFFLDVNLSPAQLGDPDLCEKIIHILEKNDFRPEKLSLEITESAEVNFNERTLNLLEKFRSAGISLSLDDFGTGYASFSKLNTLPVNTIKLDQSFVKNVEHDDYLKHVIRIMVEFAHGAGFKVVAEGIENTAQMHILLEHQVDFFQGYLFSKPLSTAELEGSLTKFSNSVNVFPVRTINSIDINTINKPGGGYSLSTDLNKLINHCMFLLNSELEMTNAIKQVLKLVGEQLRVSRAYVYMVLSNEADQNDNEWCAPGIESRREIQKEILLSNIWYQTLKNDGIILASDVALLPEGLKSRIEPINVKALVALPIWDDGNLIGVFGVDENVRNYREWSPEEVQFLYHIGILLAGIIKRYILRNEISTQSRILTVMLDQMDTNVYISDLETGKIFFANKRMQETFGFNFQEDIHCFNIMKNDKPCENCPLDELKKNNDRIIIRDSYNEVVKRYYRNYDSIIPWSGVRGKVHLHYSMDISQIHKYQDQIKLFSSMDMFNTTLNKLSFVNTVKTLLKMANESNIDVTIGILDICNLNSITGEYGEATGEEVIQSTAEVLRRTFRSYDIIGRLGGEEFVMALPLCTGAQAEGKIASAEKNLAELSALKQWSFQPRLRHGFSMNRELLYDENISYLESLIDLAAARVETSAVKQD